MKCIIKANMYKKKIEWIKNIPDMAVHRKENFNQYQDAIPKN